MALAISRVNGQRTRLLYPGGVIWVTVVDAERGKVRLAFDAPRHVLIEREEIIGRPTKRATDDKPIHTAWCDVPKEGT